EEPTFDDFEAPAAHPNRTAAVVFVFAPRVGVDEREVLHGEARVVLIVAVRGGPDLILVARVHVQDPRLSAAAQGDLAAAVDDDALVRVVSNLRGTIERDGDGVGPAVEGDHAALGDRVDERLGRAALGRARTDDLIRI